MSGRGAGLRVWNVTAILPAAEHLFQRQALWKNRSNVSLSGALSNLCD